MQLETLLGQIDSQDFYLPFSDIIFHGPRRSRFDAVLSCIRSWILPRMENLRQNGEKYLKRAFIDGTKIFHDMLVTKDIIFRFFIDFASSISSPISANIH
uniref:Uncharacterized protein n=2 Tax=Candidatus Kentrum sp. TC TaxID=2126339 RepID=A0A450YUL1_9GAMM|nr:MAG: hypothetical protein BECKTC1821E_GA0114239_104417 [Candidatus Kentron sp. TC]